jgi:hypothetical protein
MVFDIAVLAAFIWFKINSDLPILLITLVSIIFIFVAEKIFLMKFSEVDEN